MEALRMEKEEVVYGLFMQLGMEMKEHLYEKGVFKIEEDARKEWEHPLRNGCWIEEIKIR